MSHLNGHKGVKIFKYVVLGLSLMFIGNIVGKAVAADVDEEPTGFYQYDNVFAGSALLFADEDGGMHSVDMHEARIAIIQYPSCNLLVIETPTTGARAVKCVPNTLVLDEKD